MPGNFQHVPGVAYIAGQTFQSEFGVHEAGSVIPNEEAEQFGNLQTLIDNRFIWPYAPDEGYDWLPPHLFNDVKTMDEVKAILEGDPMGQRSVPQFPDPEDPTQEDEAPEVIQQAEDEAEQQDVIRDKIKATQQPGVERPEGPTTLEVAEGALGHKLKRGDKTPPEPRKDKK
jgi:hypothetical protein